ncbi:MAG: hypothetical protein PHP51_06925, partial [Desulfotomaculaceae bacterium]|nr:hypothetical protein [Desulfotomaculaceae bacterium]
DSESRQFNRIEETFKLYLDTSEPDVGTLFGEAGRNNVQTLYSGKGLSIYEVVPAVVLADQEFFVKYIVLKGSGLPPVSFTYSFESAYIKSEDNGPIQIVFNQEKNSDQDIYVLNYPLRAAAISDMQVPFGKGTATLTLGMGDLNDQVELPLRNQIYLCGSFSSYEQMVDIHLSSLEKQLSGSETPIYLAKIDYVSAGNTHILRKVTPLPFGQRLAGNKSKDENRIKSTSLDGIFQNVTTDVQILKYWQKPEVAVRYNAPKKEMNFHFGLPSSEAYDYATSSGVVEVPLSGAIRVNARYFSEEVPHNLGIGNVSLNFAVEFEENESRRLLFGSGEVFSSKKRNKAVPNVEVAGILNPDTGSFRVGVRCLDYVEGHVLRVRWFAYKVTRDTADMRSKDLVSIKINPDVYKMKVLERMHFEAEVIGTADKGVTWSLQDGEDGKIDQNGLYQAPSKPGTYELVAISTTDPEAKTSAFVIVEDK